MKCDECQVDLLLKDQPMRVTVGNHTVDCGNTACDSCPNCDYYELDMRTAQLLELHAAQIVMHEGKDISPEAFKYARKAAGFTKPALAEKLGFSVKTIEQYEDGSLPVQSMYRYALAGLLSYSERSLLGINLGYIKD